ncbi:MAG: type II toxin-antitoxin system VapC family toxin [Lachnospiraceae bacterium]|nr:type II toxin-antitoxin system VapC family toxin [Lachnospiraceae bacterium]
MVMLDANIILRYLLNDDDRMASEAEAIIKNMSVQVNIEIVAEVIYVLKGVYHIDRVEIGQCLLEFLSEINTPEPEVLKLGIETYAERNLDFPDCILYAYHMIKGYEIKTFDRKLNKLLAQ